MERWDGLGYPEGRSEHQISAIAQIVGLAKELKQYIKDNTGLSLELREDWVRDPSQIPAKEILVGKCDREESKAAYEKLGDIYRCSEGAERDVGRAIEFYELAATGGCESAKAKACELKTKREEFFQEAYKTLNSKEKVTPEKAFSAFRSAAIATAMGEIRAASLLARCYAFGFGTKKDRRSAFFWYKHAAENGDKSAYLYLGLCYSRGIGTAFSFMDAIKWLGAAVRTGENNAAVELDMLYKRKMKKLVNSLYAKSMELIHMKKFSEAAALLSSYEELGHPKSLYTLGCLYEFGRGVAKSSRKKAEEYYERACRGSKAYGSFVDPASRYKLTIIKMMR